MRIPKALQIHYMSPFAIGAQIFIGVILLVTGYWSNGYMALIAGVLLTITTVRLDALSPLFNWQVINIVVSSGVGWIIGS